MTIDTTRPSLRDVNICWNGRETFRTTRPLTVALLPRTLPRFYDYELPCQGHIRGWSFWKRAMYAMAVFGELELYGIDLNHAHRVLLGLREFHAAMCLLTANESQSSKARPIRKVVQAAPSTPSISAKERI